MALSNAERQARFQKRLRERASDPVAAVRSALDAGWAAAWAIVSRPTPDGRMYAEAEDYSSAEEYRSAIDGDARDIVRLFRSFDEEDGATADEMKALRNAADVIEAALS